MAPTNRPLNCVQITMLVLLVPTMLSSVGFMIFLHSPRFEMDIFGNLWFMVVVQIILFAVLGVIWLYTLLVYCGRRKHEKEDCARRVYTRPVRRCEVAELAPDFSASDLFCAEEAPVLAPAAAPSPPPSLRDAASQTKKNTCLYDTFVKHIVFFNCVSVSLFVALLLMALITTIYYLTLINPLRATDVEPYIMFADPDTSRSLVVNWRTGRRDLYEHFYFKAETTHDGSWARAPIESNGNYRHVVLRNLTPGTAYTYKITGWAEEDKVYFFATPPAAFDDEFTFAVSTDIHHTPAMTYKLLEHYEEHQPELVVLCGDYVMNGHLEADWQVFMQQGGFFRYFNAHPVIAASGNHEAYRLLWQRVTPRTYFKDVFYTTQVRDREQAGAPADPDYALIPPEFLHYYTGKNETPGKIDASAIPEFDEGYYSYYEYKGSLFVVLDNFQDERRRIAFKAHEGTFLHVQQLTWLRNTLQQALAEKEYAFKFLVMHVPMYSTGFEPSNEILAKTLEPLLCEYEIDAVFTGHVHFLEVWRRDTICRELGINNHTFYHIISGSGGGTPDRMLGPIVRGRNWPGIVNIVSENPERFKDIYAYKSQVYGELNFHFLIVRVQGKECLIRVYRARTGEFINEYRISKGQ